MTSITEVVTGLLSTEPTEEFRDLLIRMKEEYNIEPKRYEFKRINDWRLVEL